MARKVDVGDVIGGILQVGGPIAGGIVGGKRKRKEEEREETRKIRSEVLSGVARGFIDPEEARPFLGEDFPALREPVPTVSPFDEIKALLLGEQVEKTKAETKRIETQEEKIQAELSKLRKELSGNVPDRELSTSDLRNLVNPATFARFRLGTTLNEAKAAGAVPVDQPALNKIADLRNVKAILDQVDTLSKGLITATNLSEIAIQAPKLKIGATTRGIPEATTYLHQRQAVLGVVARSLGGERGVLTDRDIRRIDNALPNFSDTVASRQMKMDFFMKMFSTAEQAQKDKLLGRKSSPAQTQLREILDARQPWETGKSKLQDFPTKKKSRFEIIGVE